MAKMFSQAVLAGVAAAVSGTVLAGTASAQVVMYEPFDYTVDGRLVEQTHPGTGKQWLDPASPAQPTGAADLHRIVAGNVPYANLPAPVGNSFSLPNTPNGNLSRVELPDPSGYTYDTASSTGNAPNGMFLSMAVTVTEDTAFTTQNYFAGFHLGAGSTTGMSVSNGYAGMVYMRQDPIDAMNYNFGVAKNNAAGTVIGWSSQAVAPGETVFLAFQYQFATAANNADDTVNLWVNPDLAGPIPAPSATTSTGLDGHATNGTPPVTTSILRSLYFRSNGTPATPSDMIVDEVRVGLSYADVAPAASVYWDIDGSTDGSGGVAPSGNWDGAAQNFNNNSAGGAGLFIASPASDQIAVFSAGNDATGAYTVTLSGTRAAKAVNIEQGNVTLTGGTIATGTFDVASGAVGTVTSTVTGPSGSVTKTGAGTLELTKLPQSNAVNITGGKVRVLESDPDLASGFPSGDNASVSRPTSLAIPGTGPLGSRVYDGTLDLTNNDLILDYVAGSSPILDVEDMVRAGFNGGDFLGAGITSSTAAADSNYAVAVADNATLATPFGTAQGGPLFAGIDVDADTVLVKFTHRVDLDLDGKITPNDASIFGTNYSLGDPAFWAIGDLDYDGIFTPNDASIFGTFYDTSVQSLPEPASLGLLAVAGLALSRRRRLHS